MISSFVLKSLHRLNPEWLWHVYRYKSHKLFDKSYLILSFDCDTEEDIFCVEEVHTQLSELGVTPVYAVPGELLNKGAHIYRKLFENGAEFVNHGGRAHTYFDEKNNRHASCFFYDHQDYEVLKQDIYEGHNALKDVLNFTPSGWRTPHLGTFQKKNQLRFLYDILSDLKYTFSTSTMPEKAYKLGPIYRQNGMIEVPLTGIYQEPFNVMDTWAYFASPSRVKSQEDYVATAKKLALFAKAHPTLINIYGDPSHIYKQPVFFESMKLLSAHTKNVNYTQLLEDINENNSII